METLNITPERFQQALAWMNGQPSTLGEMEVLQMLRSMTGRFQENCKALRSGPVARFRNLSLRPHPLSMDAIIAETEKMKAERKAGEASRETVSSSQENPFLKELMEDGNDKEPVPSAVPSVEPSAPPTPEQEVMRTVSGESRLDSAELLNAIAYVAAVSGYTLTLGKAQLILYCLYGARLGAGRERLPIEHPQAWMYGPVFPRAFKRSAIEDRAACEASFQGLLEADQALLGELTMKTRSMMATPMADLSAVHKCERSPYGKTRARCGEKWGVQIPDEEIAEFFRGRKG